MWRKLLFEIGAIIWLFDQLTDGVDWNATLICIATPDPLFLLRFGLPQHITFQLLNPSFLQFILVQLRHVVPLFLFWDCVSRFLETRLFFKYKLNTVQEVGRVELLVQELLHHSTSKYLILFVSWKIVTVAWNYHLSYNMLFT